MRNKKSNKYNFTPRNYALKNNYKKVNKTYQGEIEKKLVQKEFNKNTPNKKNNKSKNNNFLTNMILKKIILL